MQNTKLQVIYGSGKCHLTGVAVKNTNIYASSNSHFYRAHFYRASVYCIHGHTSFEGRRKEEEEHVFDGGEDVDFLPRRRKRSGGFGFSEERSGAEELILLLD